MYGMKYRDLIPSLEKSDICLNRKVLAGLAVNEPLSFRSVIEVAKLAYKPPIPVKQRRKLTKRDLEPQKSIKKVITL